MTAQTTFLNVSNSAETTLAGAVGVGDGSLTVTSTALFPTAPFHISIDNEILEVTGVVGTTFTVTRAAEATAAAAHASGATVQLRVTAQTVTDLNAAINALEAALKYEIYIPFGRALQMVQGV